MEKIILYYKFTTIKDPDMVRLWQKNLCEKLGLKGRIIISKHGINGTLGGKMDNIKKYIKESKDFPAFKNTEYKWSDGSLEDFPKLSVKVRDEIVTFGAAKELETSKDGLNGSGKHLKPSDLHDLIESRGDDVVFFDGRNAYEASIGRFKNAVIPNARTAKDLLREVEDPKYDYLKEKAVVTYCTGGIRCEILSVLMRNRGFKEVYQLDGGIVKYGETYGDDGYWEGSLYVFDGRMNVEFSKNSKKIGKCIYCNGKTSRFINCANKACNDLVLVCQDCNRETFCAKEKIKVS